MFFVYLASMVFLSGPEIASEYPRLRGGASGRRQRRPPTYVAARLTGTMARRTSVAAVYLAAGIVVAFASITVALLVTPMQPVSVAGQTVRVGAAAPALSASGPGELDLFGQRLPTTVRFLGPVRPRLALSSITLNQQLGSLFTAPHHGNPGQAIGGALAAGWTRYFEWETAIAGGGALLLLGALAGWLRVSRRRTLVLLAAGLVAAEAVNLGAIMVTAYTAPARLRAVHSLTALAGRAALPPVSPVSGTARPEVQAVVMGDSTAAGLGNAPLPHPSKQAKACHRSADTYAAGLAAASGWQVLNLACSGATIPAGILGPQQTAGVTVPPQLAVAEKATRASVVIVSIGADDVGWSALLRLCAASRACGNRASVAYFQQRLAAFAVSYYQLLQQLAALPSHPRVLVNLYYDPFDTSRHCLDNVGLDSAKEKSLTGLLAALNGVLASGAQAAGLTSVQPDFTDHALCDPGPYVQGLHDPAPFHPTPAGELAIALADEHALNPAATPSQPSPSQQTPSQPSPS
jgi:GDSL-like Lipase/Acylhydrolase family